MMRRPYSTAAAAFAFLLLLQTSLMTKVKAQQPDQQSSSSYLRQTTVGQHLYDDNQDSSRNNNNRRTQSQHRRVVQLTGLGGKPDSSLFPLQLCQGDCDLDSDCGDGMVCFQRGRGMPVPGCDGGEEENSKTDFCVPDPFLEPLDEEEDDQGAEVEKQQLTGTLAPVAMPSVSPVSITTGAPSKMTTTTAAPSPNPVTTSPTVTPPTDAPTVTPPTDAPTVTPPTDAPTVTPPTASSNVELVKVNKVGNDGSPAELYPLGECQGDCDDDSECGTGLVCFQRDGGEDVPGCAGGLDESSRNDYCIADPTLLVQVPTIAPTTLAPTVSPTMMTPTSTPTHSPTNSPTISSPPTLQPSSSPTGVPSATPSDEPSDIPSMIPSSPPSMSLMPSVSNAPTDKPTFAPTAVTRDGVRLKLYWEEGYLWQDETVERYWCMMHTYNGSPGTGKCWHGLVTEPCHQDMVYVAKCNDDDRQKFNVHTMPGGHHFLISLAHHRDYDDRDDDAPNYCLERVDFSIVLADCDMWNAKQRFWNPRGAIWQKRMEVSPITYASQCMTQAHHPKPGEVLEFHKCSKARTIEHQSSFWTVY